MIYVNRSVRPVTKQFRKKTYSLQFSIARRLRAGTRVQANRAEEVVCAKTDGDCEGEVSKCMRLRFCSTDMTPCTQKRGQGNIRFMRRVIHA